MGRLLVLKKERALGLLVVDDSSTMRRKNTLQRFDDILEAEYGPQTWALLDTIEGIITDWNMPEMNGLDLVKKVKGDQRFVDISIIIVTTEGDKAEVITALKAGVNNYIIKPFTPQVSKEKLEAVLNEL